MPKPKIKYVFPLEVLEQTAQFHYFTHHRTSRIIYMAILVFICGVLAALPILKVEVYSTARGIIMPAKEREKLTIINSGRIVYSRLSDNTTVNAGDTLLVIDNNGLDDKLELCVRQLAETKLALNDLESLLDTRKKGELQFQTEKFRSSYMQYLMELNEYYIRYGQAVKEFKRYEYLFGKGVVSKAEYEKSRLEFTLSKSEREQFRSRQLGLWQAEYSGLLETHRELVAQQQQIIKSISQFVLIAPINGNLINVKETSPGNLVAVGTQIAEISPDTGLLAECYLDPSDIGLLRENLQVVFRLDTYDYNQWGMLRGEIQEIGRDLEYKEGIPVFKVRCRLQGQHLQLPNGVRGEIKKGMTLSAQFLLTRRTLWELLYDKTDDWLNPARNPQT